MQLESVRSLKAEIAEQIIRPTVRAAEETRRLSFRATALSMARGPQAGVALGIAAGGGRGDYKLAVRTQRHFLADDAAIMAAIRDKSRNEVDFRYIGPITKRQGPAVPWQRRRQRPLLIGSSIAHQDVTAGTLGAFALHRKTQKTVILSNNHVLANENAAAIGDLVLQPGPFDGGQKSADAVGRLIDWVPLKLSGANLVDAAISGIDDGIGFDTRTLMGLGALAGLRAAGIVPGDVVAKLGRTTGLTRGKVTAIEVDNVVVNYDIGTLSFDSQTEIEGADDTGFSSGGDSGSLILDAGLLGCGLLFAGGDVGGSNGKGLTYANDLASVLSALDLQLAV